MIITQTTQRKNTLSSYVKACELLINKGIKTDVLDYGSGLGIGYQHMTNIFSNVESFEPYAKAPFKPTYTSVETILKQYNAITCLNVLNVLDQNTRDISVLNILNLLNIKGYALISTRAFKNDIDQTKKGIIDPINKSVQFDNGLIQKGYDGNELLNYIKDIAYKNNINISVLRINNISGNCVLIQRLN